MIPTKMVKVCELQDGTYFKFAGCEYKLSIVKSDKVFYYAINIVHPENSCVLKHDCNIEVDCPLTTISCIPSGKKFTPLNSDKIYIKCEKMFNDNNIYIFNIKNNQLSIANVWCQVYQLD